MYKKQGMPASYAQIGGDVGTNLEFAEFSVDTNGDLLLSYYGSANANDFSINAQGELEVQV